MRQIHGQNKSILSELKLMNSNLESLVKERTSDLQKAVNIGKTPPWTF